MPTTQKATEKRSFTIRVVIHDAEQLFELDGVLFDCLKAQREFEDCELSIIRNGKQTIQLRCKFNPDETVYRSIWLLFGESLYGSGIINFSPNDFQVEDVFSLEMPLPFDLITYLRYIACRKSAWHKTFRKKTPPITHEEVPELLRRTKEIEVAMKERFDTETILRVQDDYYEI